MDSSDLLGQRVKSVTNVIVNSNVSNVNDVIAYVEASSGIEDNRVHSVSSSSNERRVSSVETVSLGSI